MSAYIKGERKRRKQESLWFVVKWIEGNSIYFRWYIRGRHAAELQQELIGDGIPPEMIWLQMK